MVQPASTMQAAPTAQLAFDAQNSSWWRNSFGFGAGVTAISAPNWNSLGFGSGLTSFSGSSWNSLGFGSGLTSFSAPQLPAGNYPINNSSINPLSQANNSGLPTLVVAPSPSKAAATQLKRLQVFTSPASLSSHAAQSATGSRRVSMSSSSVSPAPHYSPVSPPLAGPSGNSVAPMRTWSNNTVTGTSPSAQNTPAAQNIIPANSSPESPSSASSRASSVMGTSHSHGANALMFRGLGPFSQQSPASIASPISRASNRSSVGAANPPRGRTSTSSGPSSGATQHTPTAPLFLTLAGLTSHSSTTSANSLLLQLATGAPTQLSSQSQSTAVAPPQSSTALMASASAKHRTLSQASLSQSHPFYSSSAAPPQRLIGLSTATSSGARGPAAQSAPVPPHQRLMSSSSTTITMSAGAPPQVSLHE